MRRFGSLVDPNGTGTSLGESPVERRDGRIDLHPIWVYPEGVEADISIRSGTERVEGERLWMSSHFLHCALQ